MSASFKSWCKRIVTTFLILALFLNAKSQEEKLQPEFDINSGLHSNSVRCIKIDSKNRVWLGTDNGLNILNANTSVQNNIISAIGNKSIWGLEMMDSLVFIGTRYDGLYIFNQYTGSLFQYYPASEINLIRKIRIFDGNVFVLSNNGPFLWARKVLLKLPFTKDVNKDFALDIFKWENSLYALPFGSSQIMKYSNYEFEENANELIFGKNNTLSNQIYYSVNTSDNKLILGGGYPLPLKQSITIIEKGKLPRAYDILSYPDKDYVIWDIKSINGKIILAIGNNRTNSDGLLYIIDSNFSKKQVNASDYITCLALDKSNNSLYYGTLNNGLFLQKAISGCNLVEKPDNSRLIANQSTGFFYNKRLIQSINTSSSGSKYHTIISDKKTGVISNSSLFGDTLLFTSDNFIKIYNANSLKTLNVFPKNNQYPVSETELLNNNIYLFPNYGHVHKYSLKFQKKENVNNIESFIPYPQIFDDKIFLLNKEKGFSIITDKAAYPLSCIDKSISFSNDFTVIHDTLYTVIRNNLKSYIINFDTKQLILLKSFPIDSIVDGFKPKWLLANEGKLYILNNNGILNFRPNNGIPIHYYYFGNYNQINKPLIVGGSLIFSSGNYLNKISFREIDDFNIDTDEKNIAVTFPESVNENLNFKVSISCPEYLLQNRYLKSLEVWHNSKIVDIKYSINNQFTFNNGMKYGDYDLVFKIGKTQIKQEISITLPLNRNPYFFGAILVLVFVIIILVVKSSLEKRELNKKLLQNRLQILKQNLNPHFVFNSMNLISSLILEGKNDEAVQVVSDFSNLQRTYLETNNKEVISLQEELNFLNAYIKIQQKRFRFDNNFVYSIKIGLEVDADSIMIPPLILQPLAENAIKYGIVGSNAIEKKIRVDVNGNNPVIIGIEDNGEVVNATNKGLGLGHKLVLERVSLFMINRNKTIDILFGQPPLHSQSGYRVEIHIFN